MSINNVGGAGSVQMMNIDGLDLESSLMAVQTNRVNLLDQQLKDQMGAVQNRNNRINELNVGMTAMNKALANVAGTEAGAALDGANKTAFLAGAPQVVDEAAVAMRAPDAMMTGGFARHKTEGLSSVMEGYVRNAGPDGQPTNTFFANQCVEEQMVAAGYPVPAALSDLPACTGPSQYLSTEQNNIFKPEVEKFLAWLKDPNTPPSMKADPEAAKCTTRATAEAYIKGQQSQIDALGNTQQMDMLRLQSLSNKRNEAFEIMTNFMKKLADSRSGIISKMG